MTRARREASPPGRRLANVVLASTCLATAASADERQPSAGARAPDRG
jgi:hypothetical protein